MKFKSRTISQIADMICGGRPGNEEKYFKYRSSWYITEFFRDADTDYVHDGTTRRDWLSKTLEAILDEPQQRANTPPESFLRVISLLMDQADAVNEGPNRPAALEQLNAALAREGFEAFYSDDKQCHLRHIATNNIVNPSANPHRPFSAGEMKRREALSSYMSQVSEDELIEEMLFPLFRQLGFHRVTVAGHKDKALEYGKDVWMKFTLPTQHVLYFGIQAKKGKIDAAGVGSEGSRNVAEIHNQVTMMLGHEVFDPETGKKALVDHAFIVAGGEITKQARNWLGGKLDASKRSQIMFMDRDDILNLYVVTNLPLPRAAMPTPLSSSDDELPF